MLPDELKSIDDRLGQLFAGALTSILVAPGLSSIDNSTEIKSMTRGSKNGTSGYNIEIVKKNGKAHDIILDVNTGRMIKCDD